MESVDKALADAAININDVPFTRDDVLRGMKVEYEHGTWGQKHGLPAGVDVIGFDKTAAAKIALAHLLEKRDGEYRYDYYDGLDIIEESPSGIWANRKNYWRDSQIALLLVFVILCIVLLSGVDSWVKVATTIAVALLLYLKADMRGYLV